MTVLVYANEQADEMLSKLDSFLTITLELLKDREVPLDDRWDLYLKIEKLLPVSTFMGKAICVLSDEIYEVICYDRHEVQFYSAVDEMLHENNPAESDDPDDDYYDRYKQMWEKRDAWREAVLADKYGGFTFDW